jgi:hypothetical protein
MKAASYRCHCEGWYTCNMTWKYVGMVLGRDSYFYSYNFHKLIGVELYKKKLYFFAQFKSVVHKFLLYVS